MSSIRISMGHNTVPVELQLISPPLLALYSGFEGVETEYHDYVSRELSGFREWVEIGLPYVRWKFFRLSRAEFTLLESYSGDVSIRTLDQVSNTYKIYNGSAMSPEANSQTGTWAHDALDGYTDVVLTIYDLTVQS